MSDFLSSKLKQLEPLLSNKNMNDGISELLGLLQDQSKETSGENQNTKEKNITKDSLPQVLKWVENVSSQQDPRVDLIHALLPFLSKERKEKASQCIKILKFVGLSKFFLENKSLLDGGRIFKNDSHHSA